MGGRRKQVGRKNRNERVRVIDAECELTGHYARATCGREAGRSFLIVGGSETKGRVYIADGRRRRLGAPKLKNVRHIEVTGFSERAQTLLRRGELTDGDVRRAIYSADKPPKGESDAEG